MKNNLINQKALIQYAESIDIEEKIFFLTTADILQVDPIYNGSNYVFLVLLENTDLNKFLAVYKPMDGLRDLYDFNTDTLPTRELAAFKLDQILEWGIIPPMIIRDGPYGLGSFQEYIYHDTDKNYFHFIEHSINHESLLKLAIFDIIINNADRKGGHIIQDSNDKIWGIDNALSFHYEEKLRTVIWDFAENRISNNLLSDLKKLNKEIQSDQCELVKLLNYQEILSLKTRIEKLIDNPELPNIYPWRCWPLPLI